MSAHTIYVNQRVIRAGIDTKLDISRTRWGAFEEASILAARHVPRVTKKSYWSHVNDITRSMPLMRVASGRRTGE